MKFALIDGKKNEAAKGSKGLCPFCGAELIAKCGEIKINHWAHKGTRTCDPWWENETEWHRSWKGQFPIDWQEIIHYDENGEKHIADVKTENDWVIEFQHSYLKPEERRARNTFYPKLVWVVDGLRRKNDKLQFQKTFKKSTILITKPLVRQVNFQEGCRLIEEWHDSDALVFFDFQESKESKQSDLWYLFPKVSNSTAFIMPFFRDEFIGLLNKNEFDEKVKNVILPIRKILVKAYEQYKRENELYARKLSAHRRPILNKRRRIF